MPPLTLTLWAAAILSNGIAAFILARKSRHFPIFWLFMVASVIRGVWLFSARTNTPEYISIASLTASYMIGIEALAVVYAFWSLTDNYPRWRVAGSIFLAGMVLCGAFGAWLLRSVGTPAEWSGTWQAAYLLQRHWMVGCAIVMMLMRWMVKTFSSELMPVRPITQRAADCLAVSIAMGAITAQLVMLAGTPSPAWARSVGPLAGIVNGLLWALWLPKASALRAAVIPIGSHAEILDRNRTSENLLRGLVQAVK